MVESKMIDILRRSDMALTQIEIVLYIGSSITNVVHSVLLRCRCRPQRSNLTFTDLCKYRSAPVTSSFNNTGYWLGTSLIILLK